jgi:predicted ATPase
VAGDATEHVVNRLRHQRLLIVLDNCEHVLDAAAKLVEAILAACPVVTVIATSREPLMVAGEHLVPTPSLRAADAVALFVERLGAEAPAIVVDERQERSIEAICARLDHLPLAIELAASRARSMSPVEIEARLDERFRLLVGGRRSRMERHQTMRGTVDWSYELCSPSERHVFDRVAVFAGEFDVGGAIGVAADDGHDRFEVEEALHRLVDRSLVQRVLRPDGSSRFRLLETMRAYGRERLADDGAADVARRRHVEYVSGVAASLSLHALGTVEVAVHQRIRELAADLILALDWCIEQGEWAFVPKLCNGGLTLAAPGIGIGLIHRLAPHLPPITERVDGLPPILHVGLVSFALLRGAPAPDRQTITDRFTELVRQGETIPFDALYLVPLEEQGRDTPADLDEMAARFLDGLRGAPLPLRWYATYIATLTMINRDSEWLQSTFDEFEQFTNELGGRIATSRYRAQLALLHERRGELEHAERHLRAVLAETPLDWGDVLIALRIVRIAARRHGSLSGADLRRPIEWERDLTNGTMVQAVLASCAAGLHAAGHLELAHRTAGALVTDVREFYSAMFGATITPEVGQLFQDPGPPSEDLDSVVQDILTLADELDSRADEAELTP